MSINISNWNEAFSLEVDVDSARLRLLEWPNTCLEYHTLGP